MRLAQPLLALVARRNRLVVAGDENLVIPILPVGIVYDAPDPPGATIRIGALRAPQTFPELPALMDDLRQVLKELST